MRINIIECDELSPELKPEYHSYGTMFKTFFSALDSRIETRFFDALQQQLPPQPKAGEIYLITGSKAAAYEDHAWIKHLKHWVQQAHSNGAALLGLCFGHQLLAAALGGEVSKSSKGWGIGVRELNTTTQSSALLADKNTLKLIYSHQDQVTALPARAEPLLTDEFCPYAAFSLGTTVIAFQGHPEFSVEYTQRLLERRRAEFSPAHFSEAVASLAQQTDAQWLGKRLLRWMQEQTRR
ncbi:GMP synthase-like glutamine amidotransferase [Sinobacterium caligoides]|uniref:GMP synthase-like glutamine amidotransferase n=1 Tax=Sinobacterium caligoides TaxID=933926 RepID=A0A3N2DPK6_9GAMM|nr:amidotransferase [Sinobacterium caligoides]ROS01741.1 GMP synthase-like glutamine amidotransferase [Sinobacterium caligoides]